LYPKREEALRAKHLLTKSAASRDQPSGTSFFLIYAYLANIASRISLLLFP
jgi:hypothetical protein